MPPKKKGHTIAGKKKLFRHAVEHVRLGLGHAVLGNVTLGLAASSPSAVEGSSFAHRPAFYVELNEQLLSHSSKDLKKFRWEVLELCETVPLFHLHHRQLAQKLLARLMDRGAGHAKAEADTHSDGTKGKSTTSMEQRQQGDGSTTEAFEAFARLTIAFVRDMGAKFLPYFLLFQEAMQAGMYDGSGHLIVDTARLQLVFAVQAAWCRELRMCWADPTHAPLVRRVIQQYVGQLHDTKEYVRRLSAELLAFLCRLHRQFLSMIVEEACSDVLRSYEEVNYPTSSPEDDTASRTSRTSDQDDEANNSSADETAPSTTMWIDRAQLLHFARTELPHHPVVDGLTYFVAELFRGLRGSLNTSFETNYILLLHAFRLMELSREGGDEGQRMNDVDLMHHLQETQHPLSAYLDSMGGGENEEFGAHHADENAQYPSKPAGCAANLRSNRWPAVFGRPDEVVVTEDREGDIEGATLKSSDDVEGARYLLRNIGSLAIGTAAAAVLHEIQRHSAIARRDSSVGDESEDEASLGDAMEMAVPEEGPPASSASVRPSHRLLAAAVLCFESVPAVSLAGPLYIRLLTIVMSSTNFVLWTDNREAALLRRLASHLVAVLRQRPLSSVQVHATASCALEGVAATLGLLSPLCLSPYLTSVGTASNNGDSHLLELQQWFLPVAKLAIQVCSKVSQSALRDAVSSDFGEEAQLILFAFAQDVLQKNYAFAIEQERRAAEETDQRDAEDSDSGMAQRDSSTAGGRDTHENAYISESDEDDENDSTKARALHILQHVRYRKESKEVRIPSYLTPFALTLLHTAGMVLWQGAVTGINCMLEYRTNATTDGLAAATATSSDAIWMAQCQSSIRRAVLLGRLLQDHTPHMSATPLQQLLRLRMMQSAVSKSAHNSLAGKPRLGTVGATSELSLREVLETLVLHLLRLYETVQSTSRWSLLPSSEAMNYVSCALPIIQVLVINCSASATVSPVRQALLNLLQFIEQQEQSRGHISSLNPAAYALYAEVAAMLVQRTAFTGHHSSSSSLKKTKRQRRVVQGVRADETDATGEQESLRHLCRTITVLVQGFQQLRAATAPSQTSCSASETTAGGCMANLNTQLDITVSDEARVQLFHGAEVLLHAVLWMLGLDANSPQSENDAEVGALAVSSVQQARGSAGEELSEHTQMALRKLRNALPESLHVALVGDVLFQCLAAPIPRLRLLSLRLLRLVCHPALAVSDRFAGVPVVPLNVVDALLRASLFNPLSHTGNLDGMRQELSQLTFQVESGVVTQPFQRLLIAHTMIGFLYVKFTGAWLIAQKVLCALISQEQTALASFQDTENDTDDALVSKEGQKTGSRSDDPKGYPETALITLRQSHHRLEPVVWNTVILAFARPLIIGDVVAACAAVTPLDSHTSAEELDDPEATETATAAVATSLERLESLPCLYEVRLSDQQRHAKGELVSRVFSSTQYHTSTLTLLDSTRGDFEIVRWGQHWAATRGEEPNVKEVHHQGSRKRTSSATAALYVVSTDRSTLAQTFLSIMEAMVKSSSAIDSKVRLVEDIVLELVAIERNRHPSGVDPSQVRKLEQRLEVAMRACAAAPSGALTAHQRKRIGEAVQFSIDARNAELQNVFVSFLSEANPRLQRMAVDNLKRLRVEPFYTYHAKLAPYCDTMKALFTFLSTFDVERDIPAHERVTYISSAMSLSLPKLLTKVSKDRLKDQAVLSRRLMGFLEHLPTHTLGNSVGGAAASKNPLAEVFDQLLHRLLASAMPPPHSDEGGNSGPNSPSPLSLSAETFDFLTNVWDDVVFGGCGMVLPGGMKGEHTTSEDPPRRSSHRGVRRLERLMKQLGNALRLLEAMLHAVGQRFSVYVSTCLNVAMQAYLVACKQCLRSSVERLLTCLPRDTTQIGTSEERVRRWAALLNKSLANSALSTSFAHVRREAVTIVALLSEQFPEEFMATLHGAEDTTGSSAATATSSCAALPLFTRYLNALYTNSQGMTLDSVNSAHSVGVAGARTSIGASKSTTTPVLRLLLAWSRSPVLLPLFPAYSDIVLGTLEEVFAVTPNAASVHRASTHTLSEGLRCVSELLSCADEPVVELRSTAATKNPDDRIHRGHKRPTATFRACFLDQHIAGVFTALYTLLTSGATRDEQGMFFGASEALPARGPTSDGIIATSTHEEEAVTMSVSSGLAMKPLQRSRPSLSSNKDRARASDKKRPTSIMSLSVSMWRDVMRTIAQLSRYLHTDSALASSQSSSLSCMMSRLLELSLRMVAHPVCMTDSSTAQTVTGIVQTLMAQVPELDHRAHWQPLVRLFNVVVNPQARHTLCTILSTAASKLSPPMPSDDATRTECFRRQLAATARAVACLNSFENEETFERYDFELRYHTLHSLHDFFTHFGNYGALRHPRNGNEGKVGERAVRHERVYDGAEDVQLPLDKEYYPVLAAEAVAVLATNIVFFLRDPEQTIRALTLPLLQSMVRYASLGGQRSVVSSEGTRQNSAGNPLRRHEVALTVQQQLYRTQLLDTTLRHAVLASLRRGAVAKDVHIRCAHMQAFESFGRYFSSEFPSFARLYSPNTEQNFFANVGHVQHRCRLHALTLLRQHAAEMNVRDILRVFVPFLMSGVKDFAEGKRNQANLTEGRARGYCDAVLLTISTIAGRLPWTAYYRVLSLFLTNASANIHLRPTMLRGVVQVLNTFHFLDDEDNVGEDGELSSPRYERRDAAPRSVMLEEEEEEDGDEEGAKEEVDGVDHFASTDLLAKQRETRYARIMRVLEVDVLPQLYSYIGDKETSKAMTGRGLVNQHSITAVRREQEREDTATTQAKNALLQLPVAMAITKIVKHFPEDQFNTHVDHLLDELIKKLRTKNDKHRESARRILGAMLQETGPSKLKFVVTKLKDNLVHGYQLHVLGYTVVTFLYQLYEPNSKLLQTPKSNSSGRLDAAHSSPSDLRLDPVQEALEKSKPRRSLSDEKNTVETASPRRRRGETTGKGASGVGAGEDGSDVLDEDAAVEKAEEALLQELATASNAGFDHPFGVKCLTEVLEDLLIIFLDDYLGEIGVHKEQVEMMSTMVEVKRNRALQGFAFLGKHCDAATVMEAFLHRITWVLTPPSETAVETKELHGSARARELLVREMKSKYLTTSKGGSVDLIFVNKVRLLAVRVARSLMTNPTMSVAKSFEQVRRLLDQHNRTREEKIATFEAKDGTRRIRGNTHLILHKADRQSRKEQLDQNYLVAPVPERVDVDFSAHTVLATQQKQKLRVYRGRYGKELREAAKSFYREDPVTAVVLDTLDEFLLKFLLSVLKQVLGIGKERHYSKAAMKLDMLRHHRAQQQHGFDGEETQHWEDENVASDDRDGVEEKDEEAGEEKEKEEDDDNAVDANEEQEEDGLETFAETQAVAEDDTRRRRSTATPHSGARHRPTGSATGISFAPGSDLSVTFTREHRDLLESLVPAVLACLQGEGSDAVVANALDCLLALVSLRPPLDSVNGLQKELFETVTSFIERGAVIKQRAIRLTAAMVAHQKYVVSETNAVQLVKLIRAEVMERGEYMAVSLSLLYAVLGKHVHIAEIYDLMDVITELLLHWGAHHVIRRRCILILVRFLLEYRLTPEKFRSHIDLYCRNLDYPELTGRTALLELLDALIVRLPAVILREEAPVLLVPLAATVTGSEWVECRRMGGLVLQHLARYAGVDVLVPVLSSWMDSTGPRATRTMAAQTWATIVPTLADFYQLRGDDVAAAQESDGEDEEVRAEMAHNRSSFQACCAWSVSAVLEGCLYDQVAAARRNKRRDQLTAKSREKVEMEGWDYIFYNLRAAETMISALPQELYPLLAPRLMPHTSEVLVQHTHPWVRAVATRILRHYLYTYVESHCHYLQEDKWQGLSCRAAASIGGDEGETKATDNPNDAPLPFLMVAAEGSRKTAIAQALLTLQAFSSLFKRLLSLIGTSDVSLETYNAHRAIADPTRGELLKIAVFVLRAQHHLALFALTASASMRPRYHQGIQQRVGALYTSLRHQLSSLIAPVTQQGSLVNYMVRCTTLLQLSGGWMSVLPHEMNCDNGTAETAEFDQLSLMFNEQVRWLAQSHLCPSTLLCKCVVPLLTLGLRAKPISEKIFLIAYQVAGVIEQQLEEHRHELTAAVSGTAVQGRTDAAAAGRDESDTVPFHETLMTLKTLLASVHDTRRDQLMVRNAKKVVKRSRQQMGREEAKLQKKKRRTDAFAPPSGRSRTSSASKRRG